MGLLTAYTSIVIGMILVSYLCYICCIRKEMCMLKSKSDGMPDDLKRILSEQARKNNGTISPGHGKYEYCWYEEKGHKFIFYPHTSSNRITSIRIRVANPMIVDEEKTKILARFIKMGFHCKTLPSNWRD